MATDLSKVVGDDWSERSETQSDQRRRDVLGSLQDAGVPLSLADLAVEQARQDGDDAEEDVWERAECHWIQLYHNTVPKLEESGLVEYDRDRRTVSLSSTGRELQIDDALGETVRAQGAD